MFAEIDLVSRNRSRYAGCGNGYSDCANKGKSFHFVSPL
jgi:hypothetical protein